MAENVKIELTPELKEQFNVVGKSLDAVKAENIKAIDGVKSELNTKLDEQGKKVEGLEASINLISVKAHEDKIKEDPKRGFKNNTDYFSSVISAGVNGNRPDKMDKRLVNLYNTVGSDEARQSSNPDGGYLIPPAFLPGIETTDFRATQVDTGTMTRKVPMDSPIVYLNARVDKNHTSSISGGFVVYRREETAEVTATKATYEQIKLEANSLMGLSYATEEILARSPVSFAALIQSGFGDERISKLNYERIWGTGVGEYVGIMNSGALISVAKESGQTAATINSTNILKMRARAWRYGSAVWMANHDCLIQLMQAYIAISSAGGMPIFMPGNGTDKPDTLLGRPIIFDENMATLGTVGDIVLVNWSEYLEGQLGGLSFEESIHVRFVYNERAFRFTAYCDGAPWWRSALTPKKSSTTLGPIIALATRA